jgi:ubiquinone/menaquinone biosynthesis C-methylase UbiE
MGDARVYWADYLLGEGDGVLGYDFLCHVDAYRELMTLQAELLEAGPEHAVLDAAGGTGNYLDLLLDSDLPLPGSLEVVDLVPQALERARQKTRERAERAGLEARFRPASLDASRLRPVERFVRGELHSVTCLRGRIAGLDDETLLRIVELYGPEMHAALRGEAIHPRLLRLLDPAEQAVITDFGRLARLVRGATRPDDLRPEVAGRAPTSLRTSHLRLDVLDPGDVGVDEKLALEDAAYDRILASLMLSYLFNPEETVRELHRALRPGGRLVASTVKPDTDISTIFMDFVEGVNSGRIPPPEGLEREQFIEELRTYTDSAAFLLRLAEEQTFHLFTEKDLRAMFEAAGFHTLEVRQSFGDPPQAFVCIGVKEIE